VTTRRRSAASPDPREVLPAGGRRAEPAKWLPILLSTVAVFISAFSWLETHRGRVINEDINRPRLSLHSNGHVFGTFGRDSTKFSYLFFIQNDGKNTALITSVVGNVRVLQGPDCGGEPNIKFDWYPELPWQIAGGESVFKQVSVTYQCKTDIQPFVSILLSADYSYPGTGTQYTQTAGVIIKPSPEPTPGKDDQ
jgi:hypothetical protein